MFEEEMAGGLDLTTALQIIVNSGAQTLADRISMSGTQASIPDFGATSLTGASLTPAALPALGPLLQGARSALGGLGGLAAGAVGVLRSAGGRILGWILPSGRRVGRKAAVAMAKQFGLVAAASALGASVEDLAQAVLDEEAKPRRGRGITASQLRTTTRTIGKIERAHKQIARAARAHSR